MKRLLSAIGIILVFGVGFSPFIAKRVWGDPFIIMESPWYMGLIFSGFALIFLPSILGSVLGLGTVKKGEAAVGVITSVKQTGTYINNQPEVRLGLTVTKKGEDNYSAELTTIIPLTSMAQFQPGAIIPLIVSEKNKKHVGIDMKGQVSQEDLQTLMDERMIKQGVSSELIEVSRTGEKAYAKVLEIIPLGHSADNKIKLQLTLSITKPDGETFNVTTQKEMLSSNLPKVQPGNIIHVVYSPKDPSKLVIALQANESDLQQIFGA